ncbi:ATP-binding cassette domain-containing protein [bacterium]|nr:ATP-binding cassette domain-containing protein [bacterium]
MQAVLQVTKIRKQYGRITAVNDLSFEVEHGEIFALLGPNGAGKTTTVRMLLNILQPDSGEITFRFNNGTQRSQPEHIGYLPEERGLYPDLPVLQSLAYFGTLHGMNEKQALRRAATWLERLELADRATDKVQTLSKGNQQKVQFIASILHKPRLAVLDEPFSGLDPVNQSFFLDLLREMQADGMTILLSAHQMNLVERIADRILLMAEGRTVLHGSMVKIRRDAGIQNRLAVRPGENTVSFEDVQAWEEVAGVEIDNDGEWHLLLHRGADLGALLQRVGEHLHPADVRLERPDLHDIYVTAVQESNGKRQTVEKGARA